MGCTGVWRSVFAMALLGLSACSSSSDTSNAIAQANISGTSQPSPANDAPQSTPQLPSAADVPNVPLPELSAATETTVQYLRVKHHMVECEGYHVDHCLLTQQRDSQEWLYFYGSIEGFEYQWGYDYELRVEIQNMVAGFPGESPEKYVLLEVISQLRHDTDEVFRYTARNSHERIIEQANGRFSLLGKKEFTCSEEGCNNVRSAMAQNQSTVLSFYHNTDPSEPLVLESVLCSDAAISFAESCL